MTIPVEVTGFSLNQVNRVRDQIIAERKKKYDEAVFGRQPNNFNCRKRGGAARQ
jgi:hypothetical protein